MAGFFLFLCFWHFLGGYLDSIVGVQSWIPLLPSVIHLGFHLGSLCFRLSSILDSILDPILGPLVSILEFLPTGSGKVFLSTSDTQIVQT